MTIFETRFRELYPNARVEEQLSFPLAHYEVFAGDYLCSASTNRGRAFKLALEWVEAGFITPDANEVAQ